MVSMFDYKFDYRDRLERIRRRGRRVERNRSRISKAERYVLKINEGCGSRKFKEWLLSRPMDAYVKKVYYGRSKCGAMYWPGRWGTSQGLFAM